MKKIFTLLFIFIIGGTCTTLGQYIQYVKYTGAIGDEDWTRMWTQFKPNTVNYLPTNMTLPNIIDKNLTLYKRNTYLLQGIVYVCNGATLTIEPGTLIRGDKASVGTLVIAKGAKLIANGTETDPIVFTSNNSPYARQAGDWGGIIILGDAQINKIGGVASLDWGLDNKYAMYGGNNDNDNSGSLKYVRIEYCGAKISKDVELNGLTLAGVGKGTTIENIQVSYSNDDSFEMFGGSVYLKNIISYKCSDDDFDFNFGYNGRVQFAIAVRHPLIADFSGSRCIEADSYSGQKSTMDPSKRITDFAVANLTLIVLDPNNNTANINKEAIAIGKDCNISLYNSIISGFKHGITFKDENIKEKAVRNEIKMSNNLFNRCEKILYVEANYDEVNAYFTNAGFKNKAIDYNLNDLLKDPFNKDFPDFRIQAKDFFEAK
ncbi:MAG: T9SS C-terminal target domain-containing protein [Cytophagaceae bacterium]|nr:T9SS C-terminal target domain-containing protein [Cytophagaceae bacterium]MDW8455893.1 T9SS C-terminal target domain-containing protein [Cytophagaceae bacterium]